MQQAKDNREINNFTLEAITTLFDPLPSDSSRLITPDHARSRFHGRNISTESASSYTTLVEGSGSHSPHHSVPHPRSTSGMSSGSPTYEPYPKYSSQARKRANSEDDDSDDLEPLDSNATEDQKRTHKRRQNTLAARRSRARKAHETQILREENQTLKTEVAVWKERARMMEQLLATHGIPCPSFST